MWGIKCVKQGNQCLARVKSCSNNSGYKRINYLYHMSCGEYTFSKKKHGHVQVRIDNIIGVPFAKGYCTRALPKNANIFGDLVYQNYEKVKMDEDEAKEETFVDNEMHISKWQKLSPGQYAKLIKDRIGERDLEAALKVLDLVKQNRDKPNAYMYGLLIRAYALQGDEKQCFKLFNQMKKRGLKPKDAIYNSLLNACAVTRNTKYALEHLSKLREFFYETNYPLNSTHYNTMIKAYSWNKDTATAFMLADEMIDKRIPVREQTYACLFHGAIADKEGGLNCALVIWHMMRRRKCKIDVIHYNLLLKTIAETKFGKLKINDILVPQYPDTQIELSETKRPDLLASPPLLSSLVVLNELKIDIAVIDAENSLSQYLNNVLTNNRLVLFGGFEKFLKRMEDDNVKPDTKTMTIIMELLPNSIRAEEDLIKYASNKKIHLDVDFFNMLIKKRNMRRSHKEALDVLNEMQVRNFPPTIITFGVLALGCEELKDAIQLLEQMEHLNYVPNDAIVGTLLHKACIRKNFKYVLYLMKYILDTRIRPSRKTVAHLEKFEELVLELIKDKTKYKRKRMRAMEFEFKDFKVQLKIWKENINKLHFNKSKRSDHNSEKKTKPEDFLNK